LKARLEFLGSDLPLLVGSRNCMEPEGARLVAGFISPSDRARRRSAQNQRVTTPSPTSPSAHPPDVEDATVAAAIFCLLAMRASDATICPSEVARALTDGSADWRRLMPRIREVSRDLAQRGLLEVTRHGAGVDATSRGGPIRLGLPRSRSDP
jgi:hypothetical protein